MSTKIVLLDVGVFLGLPLLLGLFMIVFDVYMGAHYGKGATISEVMRRMGEKNPLVPFLFGFIMGSLLAGLGVHFWQIAGP